MAKKYVAELLVDVLAEAGVRRIYGISGDSLNGITESIRATNSLQWILMRHEETAAFAAEVPVLAIAAQIPSAEIGSGYFQETDPEHLFAQCSHCCELVSQCEQMPRVLEIAMQSALSRRGVAVIALPGDIALRDAVENTLRLHFSAPMPIVCPSDDEITYSRTF
jgi:pyruvate dehydrogenase (quinone)